jgi:hypothetical protein
MKKAFLVTFSICTRVVIDHNGDESSLDNDLAMVEQARKKIMKYPEDYIGFDNIMVIDEDVECPYKEGEAAN